MAVSKHSKRLDGRVLVALDGTEYFRSKKIRCEHCLHSKRSGGGVAVAVCLGAVAGSAVVIWETVNHYPRGNLTLKFSYVGRFQGKS